jgi:sialate O-acetylesterase
MITSWRDKWQSNFPFYYVQIAPYKYGREFEGGVLRDQQRRTLQLENTGMAMTSDICTVEDIHPQNKQDVGLRLANIALKQHFETLDSEVYGPLFESFKVNGKEIEVIFSNAQGLVVKGKNLENFEVSNENGEWYPAKTKIKNNKVIVSSKDVKNPIAVRYAWKSTDMANLFNEVGLPASSFTSQN